MAGTKRGTGSHSFAQVPRAEIQRSTFDRSHTLKTNFSASYLIPVLADEALPGDTFNMRMHTYARMATPVFPILDNCRIESFFFAVPMRLIFANWQKFCGEQTDPADSTDFTIPQMTSVSGTGSVNTLSEYLGIPMNGTDITHSSLWHRAYNLIWNEWFRDENLQDSVVVDTDDGPDTAGDYVLLKRGKRKDYFTSCLPWPQKGDAVELPLGTSAVVTMDTQSIDVTSEGTGLPLWDVGGSTGVNLRNDAATPGDAKWSAGTTSTTAVWNDPALELVLDGATGIADLSGATAATINELRQAFQIQKLYERDARGGTRYTEIVRAHFGVTSPDARLQRPEYLGGGTQVITVTPVPNQSKANSGTVGDLAGYGVSQGSSHSWTRSFTEHCIIIGLVMVRGDITYQQGLERQFSRLTRWDYYWPALAHIGEQSVLNQEIYAQGTDDAPADIATFGYQERWAEYRYKPSRICGVLNSTALVPLDKWHLAEEFGAIPTLSASFITDNTPLDRVVAVVEYEFLFDAFFDYKCTRPLPTFSVPGLIDHF